MLPRVESSGLIAKDKRMSYASFVLFLRHALTVTGMPIAKAARYAGHSMRAGGATSAAIHGLSPAEICHLAEVKDINWLTWYNRHYLASRIRASCSIGLWQATTATSRAGPRAASASPAGGCLGVGSGMGWACPRGRACLLTAFPLAPITR